MKPDEIIKKLLTDTWTVFFKKVSDGSLREMKCSLMEEYVGRKQRNTFKKGMTTRKDVLPVWDIDSKGWRSFRFNTVIGMKKE